MSLGHCKLPSLTCVDSYSVRCILLQLTCLHTGMLFNLCRQVPMPPSCCCLALWVQYSGALHLELSEGLHNPHHDACTDMLFASCIMYSMRCSLAADLLAAPSGHSYWSVTGNRGIWAIACRLSCVTMVTAQLLCGTLHIPRAPVCHDTYYGGTRSGCRVATATVTAGTVPSVDGVITVTHTTSGPAVRTRTCDGTVCCLPYTVSPRCRVGPATVVRTQCAVLSRRFCADVTWLVCCLLLLFAYV
jgi:hypothetical protein